MPDYTLAGLSPRSFEQLIQSLAIKVIGPNVVIYGDGPDGGREATFDGAIPFPSPVNTWRGYGVVQAKFKQKPEDTARDGAWALEQLEADLKKFIDPERKLRKPQYYIFATNVVLTPVAGKGSKDKAEALIKRYQRRLGLIDYAIWDYDTIRSMLDDHEQIRHAYAAWITPGDVLSEVVRWLKPRQPDFTTIITNFLQKELLADQYARLEQAGHAKDTRIPLARVFVDLPTAAERSSTPPDEQLQEGRLPAGFVAHILSVAAQRLDSASLHQAATGLPMAERRPPAPGRFVLIGGPGQGKSTVGQFICQLFRAALLRSIDQHLLSDDACEALALLDRQCEREGMQLPTARRFPLYVVLNEFAARLDPSHAQHVDSLLAYLVDRVRRRTTHTLAADDLRDWLRSYPWLLVLDGLDEVPASSNRGQVLDAIKDFWIDATGKADLLVVATTRPQGYNDDFSPHQYQHRWLPPLSKPRALHYAGRLAELRHANDPDRQEKIVGRLQRAAENDATARLMGSPLQVTIMTVLVDQMGQPPQDRWSLFKAYYGKIYDRELERETPAAPVLRERKTDIEVIHRRVGLLLQLISEQAGTTDARLSEQRFTMIVNRRLSEEQYADAELATLSRQIIEAATDRLVFLVGLETDRVGFEIRSLQEFMAAEALMDGDDQQVEQRLEAIAPIASWRNVFLFSAGKCFAERERLRDKILAICTRLNDLPDDPAARVTLAGSRLALDLLEDGPARSKPGFAPSFARLALRLLDVSFVGADLRLADVYEASMEHVYHEELEQRIARPGTLQSENAWACLLALVAQGVSWAQQLAERYWNGAGQERAAAVSSVIRALRGNAWLIHHLIDVAPQASMYNLLDTSIIRLLARTTQTALPEWFVAALNIVNARWGRGGSTESTVGLIVPELPSAKPALRFAFVALDDEWLLQLRPLLDMPQPDPAWQICIAAVRFGIAPSRTTLAQALRTIAPYPSVAPFSMSIMSWPLRACLNACADQQQCVALVARIEAGELGDLADWQAAEQRWKTRPLTVTDIEHMTDVRWPFDTTIAIHGFPFGVSSPDFLARLASVAALLTLYPRLPLGRMRSAVASWVVSGLWNVNLAAVDLRPVVQDLPGIQQVFYDAQPSYQHFGMLEGFASAGILDEQWIDVLDQFGKLKPDTTRPQPETARWLAQTFSAHPTRLGLICLLALTMSGREKLNIVPALVDPARYDDPIMRGTAAFVRAVLGFSSADEATQLARYAAPLASSNVLWLSSWLSNTIETRTKERFNEDFLLELLQAVPAEPVWLKGQIVAHLNDAVRRRTSRLHEHNEWQRLALPDGLNSI